VGQSGSADPCWNTNFFLGSYPGLIHLEEMGAKRGLTNYQAGKISLMRGWAAFKRIYFKNFGKKVSGRVYFYLWPTYIKENDLKKEK